MARKLARRRVAVGGFEMGARERKYLSRVINSNRISHGYFSRRFEKTFARAHNCSYAVFCNSGTSALHLALAALKERHGWEDGDEVLVPAVTFVATANVVLHNRLRPVFVDVEATTYNMDPAQLERHLTKRTRAIMPVHLLGLPADMGPIMAFARRNKLRVIEDSCETVFARYKGHPVGSFGDIACFSTYVAHYIVTGVGGLATTNDPDLAVRLRSLMNHGRDSIYLDIDAAKGKRGAALREVVSRRFRFVSLGHSFRATEFEAALGLAQLERKPSLLRKRRAIACHLTERLRDLEDVIQLPTIPADREHVFMLYPIIMRKGDKTPLVHFLEQRGVETRDLLPLLNQPVYRRLFGDLEPLYPVARWLNRGGLYVGCHPYMSTRDADYIATQVHAYFKR